MKQQTENPTHDYKLVAIDLDDTLLQRNLTISATNQNAIRQAIEQGVVVTIATGRMFRSAKRYASQLELDVPLITYQGALIRTALTDEILYEKILDQEIATAAIQFANKRGIHVQAYANDVLFTQKEDEEIQAYSKMSGVPYQVADLLSVVKQGSIKVLYSGEPDVLDELLIELKDLFGNRANVFKSKPYYLEVTHPEATKGQALDFLAQKMGVTRQQVVAMGDSYNDIDMIQYAGMGIAMGNAPEEIRDIADYVTVHHEKDGVAEALNRFVL